jgi:hypothetical protein
MQTSCCYATQDKTWVKDPDRNEWEVFVVLQDNLPEQAAPQSCCVSGCCNEHTDHEAAASCSCQKNSQEQP